MGKTIMTIGGHIGDAELTVGALMASNAIDGGKNIIVALTAGERGNPANMSVDEYRKKKIIEAKNFASMVNGISIVLDYQDGELPNNEQVRKEVAELIVKYKPDVIVTHWHSSMHKDHNATHYIVRDAQFLASVVKNKNFESHYAPLYFAENWEDDQDFKPYIYVDVTKGYDLWCNALHEHWFVMNSKDFKYYDYYTSLAKVRGALCKKQYAECFNVLPHQKKVFKDEL